MTSPTPKDVVQRFSTAVQPKSSRFDSYMHVLSDSMWQVTDWSGTPKDLSVDLRAAPLGCLTVVANKISAHHSHRTKADVERSAERNFHFFVSTHSPWAFTHQGRHERLEIGDVVIFGEGEHETHVPQWFDGVIVKCSEAWMKTWVRDPNQIIGRALSHEETWGRVLSPMLRQLTPEFATGMQLPPSMVVDQLGSVLGLMEGDAERRARPVLLAKIRDCLLQRCTEPGLSAADVAVSLALPVDDVHHTLVAGRTTFAAELRKARVLRPNGLRRRTG